ncbi:unnamed protein product [Blepharisma stoltei]|uniref:Uncharacterized protein n=1 Tax=Blepharisma stoltei TaxID=1481888 RepID=A0AAU9JBQ0_9CILI|nr:unnamed protein product [Blepharisma stoltei]
MYYKWIDRLRRRFRIICKWEQAELAYSLYSSNSTHQVTSVSPDSRQAPLSKQILWSKAPYFQILKIFC